MIFEHLDFNHVLKVRQTCRRMKAIANDFIRIYGESDQEIVVHHNCNIRNCAVSLSSLMKMELPVVSSNFTMCFPKHVDMFERSPELSLQFANHYGGQIKILCISVMNAPLTRVEQEFYGKFTTLEVLCVDSVVLDEDELEKLKEYKFPPALRHLDFIYIANITCKELVWNLSKSNYFKALMSPWNLRVANITRRPRGTRYGTTYDRPQIVDFMRRLGYQQ